MRISGVLRMLSTVVLLQWAAQEIALGEAAEGFGQRWTPQWFLTMGFLAWCSSGSLTAAAAPTGVLDAAEQRLYDELEKLCRGRAVTLTPGMRLVDALGKQIRQFSAEERELALRLRFTCAVLDGKTCGPWHSWTSNGTERCRKGSRRPCSAKRQESATCVCGMDSGRGSGS